MRGSRIIALLLLAATALTPLGALAADHALKGVALVIGESDYRAIEDYRAALTGFTRDAAPLDWAQTQADLGIAALARAERTGSREDLLLARDAYAAALEVYSAVGQDYADYLTGKLEDIDRRLRG